MSDFPIHVRATTRAYTDTLLRLPNVVGVGAAMRRRRGKVTDEPIVVTYVTRKLPPDALRHHERVPNELEGDNGLVGTDVVEVGESRFTAVDTATYRPLRGGCQIETADGTGTGGAVMYDRRDGSIVLLTNNHVLTTTDNPTTLPANTDVTQPSGGMWIGNSKRIVPQFCAPLGEFGYRWSGVVDAGIVEVDSMLAVEFDVVELGRHPYVVLPPFPGLAILRRGYRTQLREGTVESIDVTIIIRDSAGALHRIENSFGIRSPEGLISAMKGDSGSLVIDSAGGAARGLVFASNEQSGGITWANDLGTVMRVLELDTPCTGALNAQIRRAVRRRLLAAMASAESSLIVKGQIDNFERFRAKHLTGCRKGSMGASLEHELTRSGFKLSMAVANDDDAAGLLDLALGDWFIQPTVFDMLEYVWPKDILDRMGQALDHINRCNHGETEPSKLHELFRDAGGRSMRELLGSTSL